VAKSINAGIGGNTSTQMLARIDPLLTDDVGLLVLEAGANDSKVAGFTPAQFASNMDEMVQRARVKGIPVVMVGVPPKEASVTSDNARFMANIDIYNSWMRFYCQTNGIPFADIYPDLADPTTFMLKSSLANTEVQHINSYGHEIIAQVVARRMREALVVATVPEKSQRAINLVANGFMAGEGSTGGLTGLPAGWTRISPTGPTFTIESDTSGVLPGGRWLSASMPSGTTTATVQASIGLTAKAGDVIAISGVILIEDLSGDWENNCVAGTANAYMELRREAAGTGITPSFDRTPGLALGGGRFVQDRTWYVGTATASNAEYLFRFNVTKPSGSSARARLGAVSVINLTQNSLTEWS
jgi:lysophospholipase L1-like esterase